MKEMVWNYVKPLENPDSVKAFLRVHGISLPEMAVECLEKNNGGRPDRKRFDTDKGKEYVFQCLLSYNGNDQQSIHRYYADFEKRGIYPVAMDAAGNIICIDLEDGRVLLWRHETARCETICNSFDELQALLY